MSAHAYTEDQLVEQPAIGLFAELGWQTVSAMEAMFDASGTLGRETPVEVYERAAGCGRRFSMLFFPYSQPEA